MRPEPYFPLPVLAVLFPTLIAPDSFYNEMRYVFGDQGPEPVPEGIQPAYADTMVQGRNIQFEHHETRTTHNKRR